MKGFANDLFLSQRLNQAEIVRADSAAAMFELLKAGKLDAASNSRDALLAFVDQAPGFRVLDDSYQDVAHAAALPKGRAEGVAYLNGFIAQARDSGLIARLIARNKLAGEKVAPAA